VFIRGAAAAPGLATSTLDKESRRSMSDLRFERDILPLLRPEDVEAMSFALDLSSYDDVCENAEEICSRLADGTMPCDAPWPEEHVERFRNWIDVGTPG
jgi:hypothetical protein